MEEEGPFSTGHPPSSYLPPEESKESLSSEYVKVDHREGESSSPEMITGPEDPILPAAPDPPSQPVKVMSSSLFSLHSLSLTQRGSPPPTFEPPPLNGSSVEDIKRDSSSRPCQFILSFLSFSLSLAPKHTATAEVVKAEGYLCFLNVLHPFGE